MKTISKADLSQLRQVRLSDASRDLSCFPDFLLIGPQRTGTSWLAKQLAYHPEIFIPPEKELFFFYRHKGYWPSYLPPYDADVSWYLQFFELSESESLERARSDRARFGENFDVRVRGEATASYAVGMSNDAIHDVLLIKPALKVVLVVRNPIERAWSHAKKDLGRNRNRSARDIPLGELEAFFENWFYFRCGLFTELIDKWGRLLLPGCLHVDSFDEIAREPVGFLRRMYRFLGVRDDERFVDHGLLDSRVQATEAAPIPSVVRRMLMDLYAEEMHRLALRGFKWSESGATG